MIDIIIKTYLQKGSLFLDSNNILWKYKDDKYIGKRAIQTKDLRQVWLEDVNKKDIKSYMSGEDADYNEIFTKINI